MHLLTGISILLFFWLLPFAIYGQDSSSKNIFAPSYFTFNRYDTIVKREFASSLQMLIKKPNEKLWPDTLISPKPFLLNENIKGNFSIPKARPLLTLGNGAVSYNFLYRSNIDTPFIEKNIAQHQALASFGFTLLNLIPLRTNAYLRRSNSNLFGNITDLQIQFDASSYKSQVEQNFRQRLYSYSQTLKDTITEKYYSIAKDELTKLSTWIKDPQVIQKLVEANEIVNVPGITYEKQLPDSINIANSDALKRIAKTFLDYYNDLRHKEEQLSKQVDSLKMVYENSVEKVKNFRQIIQESYRSGIPYSELKRKAELLGFRDFNNSGIGSWLLGVRNFGIGKNNIYASELTAKNVTVNGLNIEYNSWYYVQIVAGSIDYRYRDFMTYRFNKPHQNLYLIRVGLGNIERNTFIVSVFHGEKQFFGGTLSSRNTNVPVSGLSVEAKWQLQANSYLISEVAQSFSPNLQVQPSKPRNAWSLSDASNKAMSLKLYSYFPKTSSRIEAKYKFTGANFQSFNSFQINSQTKSWSVKVEQSFLNRRIKIAGNLSKDEFSNPFIRQNYKSNTVFKTFSIKANIKKMPVVTIGYLPMSQLTMVDGYLSESKFQTINASIGHIYKIGQARGSSNLVFTRFFNNNSDTGYIYFNSINIFGGQAFFFKNLTININLSTSKNSGYTYTVVEENMSFPLRDNMNIGVGVKLNKLNQQAIRLGGFLNGNLNLFRKDILSFQVEQSYLPARNLLLVPGIFGSVSYTKTLK